jgi:hypothetical protein
LSAERNSSEFFGLNTKVWSRMMHATIRRYEGADESRVAELTTKINESLIPKLSKLPGFSGYYAIESEKGVLTSFGLFDTPAEADESTRIAADWVREEKLESALPNPPVVSDGRIVAMKSNGLVKA